MCSIVLIYKLLKVKHIILIELQNLFLQAPANYIKACTYLYIRPYKTAHRFNDYKPGQHTYKQRQSYCCADGKR